MHLTGMVNTEGWRQLSELLIALGLSFVIGLEREFRQKSAGLRTHTLVGLGAALFVLISKYGFSDVLEPNRVVLDPSRVAAQIVSGIGFLGAGLIFVRRGDVKGLTTAATVWLAAGVGAAAGAGLPLLAGVATTIYVFVALVFPFITKNVGRLTSDACQLRVTYPSGRDMLRRLLAVTSELGFVVEELATEAGRSGPGRIAGAEGGRMVEVTLQVHGRGSANELAAALSELPDVHAVVASGQNGAKD